MLLFIMYTMTLMARICGRALFLLFCRRREN